MEGCGKVKDLGSKKMTLSGRTRQYFALRLNQNETVLDASMDEVPIRTRAS